MKTVNYCTHCWTEVPEQATVCPRCGDDIAARQASADFVEKLIAALHHPEPTTPIRAAWILGQRREREAVEPLIQLARTCPDPFLVESAVEALGKIGDPRALGTLHFIVQQHPNLRVRRMARLVLAGFPKTMGSTSMGSDEPRSCPYCKGHVLEKREVEHSIAHWPYILTVRTEGWVCATC